MQAVQRGFFVDKRKSMALLSALRRAKPESTELVESAIMQTIPADRIDREAGVIRGVKIIGHLSKNNGGKRRYTDKAIAEGVSLYEGAEVNLNHPQGDRGRERPLIEGWGVLRGAKKTDDGARGDLHYLVNHPDTPWLLERIEKGMPIGLSHNARGKTRMAGDEQIVESIAVVHSVDLVTRPATNKNLLESEQPTVTKTLQELIESTGYKHTTKLLEMLPTEMDAEAPVEVPAEEAGSSDPLEAVAMALAAKVGEAIADSSVDDATVGKMAKAASQTVNMVREKMDPEAAPQEEKAEGEGETEEKEEEVKESIKTLVSEAVKAATKELTESFEPIRKQAATQNFLAARKINPTLVPAAKLQELRECADETAMVKLVESWPPFMRGAAPPAAKAPSQGKPTRTPSLLELKRG